MVVVCETGVGDDTTNEETEVGETVFSEVEAVHLREHQVEAFNPDVLSETNGSDLTIGWISLIEGALTKIA